MTERVVFGDNLRGVYLDSDQAEIALMSVRRVLSDEVFVRQVALRDRLEFEELERVLSGIFSEEGVFFQGR